MSNRKIGRFFRVFCLLCISLVLTAGWLFVPQVKAQEYKFSNEITTELSFTEKEIVQTDAKVAQRVVIKTQDPTVYPSRFTLGLSAERIKDFQANSANGSLLVSYEKGVNSVNFPPPPRQQRPLEFTLSYILKNAAEKKGSLWEVSIPTLSHSAETQVTSQKVRLRVPTSWGKMSIAYPPPTEVKEAKDSGQRSYLFTVPNNNAGSEIDVVFGDRQLYDVKLRYQLENKSNIEAVRSIAFPPTAAPYQEVYIQKISPWPRKLIRDADGNFLGEYELERMQTLTVVFEGQVVLASQFINPSQLQDKKLNRQRYLLPDKYWEVNSEQMAKLAAKLKTPRAIYGYVTQNLSYDLEKVKTGKIQRMGALAALELPDQAACMEFTDLTIALMRAAGIPAREVNGHAYLKEDEMLIKPTLSDVLHAWVQYWDEEKGWVNIDPTWGSTTRRDYFSVFDYSHLAFVFKGITSQEPFPAGSYRLDDYNSRNVVVSLADKKRVGLRTWDEWIAEFNYQRLPWWQKLWNWLMDLLGRLFG